MMVQPEWPGNRRVGGMTTGWTGLWGARVQVGKADGGWGMCGWGCTMWVEVGRTGVVAATGLRDSSMLTQDENIVDIRFTVQYRRTDARAYLFENNRPDEAVVMAAETAVREIVGKSKVDSVLYEQRDAMDVLQVQAQRLEARSLIHLSEPTRPY